MTVTCFNNSLYYIFIHSSIQPIVKNKPHLSLMKLESLHSRNSFPYFVRFRLFWLDKWCSKAQGLMIQVYTQYRNSLGYPNTWKFWVKRTHRFFSGTPSFSDQVWFWFLSCIQHAPPPKKKVEETAEVINPQLSTYREISWWNTQVVVQISTLSIFFLPSFHKNQKQISKQPESVRWVLYWISCKSKTNKKLI